MSVDININIYIIESEAGQLLNTTSEALWMSTYSLGHGYESKRFSVRSAQDYPRSPCPSETVPFSRLTHTQTYTHAHTHPQHATTFS